VAPDCATKDNQQGCKKALSKKNQELSREASPALLKLNKSTSQAGYKHSLKAFNEHSINSLKRRKRLDSLFFFP
jgi:uncharacterized Zn finger protein